MRRRAAGLPAPRVVFGDDFLARLGRLGARLAAGAERREGAGRAALLGTGEEFVGYRPYRPGEDLRHVDWNLFARLDRAYVRVSRREASERWAVLLDSSGSMGLGAPGKLQLAAEVATGFAALAARRGARVELWCSASDRSLRLARRADLRRWMDLLESETASGERGAGALLARAGDAGRVFVVGDLLDLEPADLLTLVRRGRELFAVQVLAPEELAPERLGPQPLSVRWLDAEGRGSRRVRVDRELAGAYLAVLERRLEAWSAACARHGVGWGCWRSDTAFEDVVSATLAP